ncbi:MAG: immunity 50 family protein [Pseudomonadales bacterium]|nr:immunity 50 family protein [Pseudomonadales bacterium]
MKITRDFDKLSFHDAEVVKIVRKNGTISIEVSGVFISREHPESKGKDWISEAATLVLLGVKEEVAKHWDDTKEAKPHPEPEFPLDEIMHANFENGVFHFDGFRETFPWCEWFITAEGFLLEATSAQEQSS